MGNIVRDDVAIVVECPLVALKGTPTVNRDIQTECCQNIPHSHGSTEMIKNAALFMPGQ